jgi:hypothetical protein
MAIARLADVNLGFVHVLMVIMISRQCQIEEQSDCRLTHGKREQEAAAEGDHRYGRRILQVRMYRVRSDLP